MVDDNKKEKLVLSSDMVKKLEYVEKLYNMIINAARQYHEKEKKDNPYAIMIER